MVTLTHSLLAFSDTRIRLYRLRALSVHSHKKNLFRTFSLIYQFLRITLSKSFCVSIYFDCNEFFPFNFLQPLFDSFLFLDFWFSSFKKNMVHSKYKKGPKRSGSVGLWYDIVTRKIGLTKTRTQDSSFSCYCVVPSPIDHSCELSTTTGYFTWMLTYLL